MTWTLQTDVPEAIEILGQSYSVRRCEHIEHHGECRSDSKEIVLHKDSTGDTAEQVLLHEAMHAILHESGIAFAMENFPGLEESTVRALEHGLWRAGYRRGRNL